MLKLELAHQNTNFEKKKRSAFLEVFLLPPVAPRGATFAADINTRSMPATTFSKIIMKRHRRFGVPSGGSLKYCADCVNDNHCKLKMKQENLIATKYRNVENDTRNTRTIFSCNIGVYQCTCCVSAAMKGRRKIKGYNKDDRVAKKLANEDSIVLN